MYSSLKRISTVLLSERWHEPSTIVAVSPRWPAAAESVRNNGNEWFVHCWRADRSGQNGGGACQGAGSLPPRCANRSTKRIDNCMNYYVNSTPALVTYLSFIYPHYCVASRLALSLDPDPSLAPLTDSLCSLRPSINIHKCKISQAPRWKLQVSIFH